VLEARILSYSVENLNFCLGQRLDAEIALAESNVDPSDQDSDRLLSLYSEQRSLRSRIQALMEKETAGGPASVTFSYRVLLAAEEILVIGRGCEAADVVIDAFGVSGRGDGAAKTTISQVFLVPALSLILLTKVWQLTQAHSRCNWFVDSAAASKIGNAKAFQ
jgi:hypothetical protein